MSKNVIYSLINNICLIMFVGIIYSMFRFKANKYLIVKKSILGIIVFFIGILVIYESYEIIEGFFIDSRSLLFLTSGMFLGCIPTIISGLLLIIYRIYIGGVGTFAGIFLIVSSSAVGLIWRHTRLKPKRKQNRPVKWYEFYIINLLYQIIFMSYLFVSNSLDNNLIYDFIPYLLILLPIAGLFISIFMFYERRKYFTSIQIYESENQYRNLFIKNKAMLLLINPETGDIIDANESAIKKYGYSHDEFISKTIYDINPLSKDVIDEAMSSTTNQGKDYFIFQHKKADDTLMDVEIHTTSITVKNYTYIYSTIFDITEKLRLDNELVETQQKLKETLLSVGEGVIVTDKSGYITLINKNAAELLCINQKPVVNEFLPNIFRAISEELKESFNNLLKTILNGETIITKYYNWKLQVNDINIFINFTINPILSKNNTINGSILIFRDITRTKKKQDEIMYFSQHDHLTGLGNRYYFEKQMQELDKENQLPISIIVGDVNGLKLLNDTFSHLEGDSLLIEIASIIKSILKPNYIASRWGGDEYGLILPKTSLEEAEKLIKKINILCKNSTFNLIKPSISLGAATKENSNEDLYNIFKKAEEFMYREKLQQGKSMRNSLITALENTLLEKSKESSAHSKEMIVLSKKFAKELNLDMDTTNQLTLVARLHDIGKITVSEEILQKSSPLTKEEWSVIKNHPIAGSRIVKSIPELQHISKAILYHHEHYDGSGYPEGLHKTDIPLISRMVAIIDAYQVMITGRIYTKKVSHKKAIAELNKCKGKQFDPFLVDEFIKSIEKE